MTAELLVYATGRDVEAPPELTPKTLEMVTRFGWSIPKATTRSAYASDLEALTRWLNRQRPGRPIDLLALTRTVLDAWRNDQGSEGLAANTIARRLTGVSSFLAFCVDEGVLVENVAAKVKRPAVSSDGSTKPIGLAAARRVLALAEADTPRSFLLVATLATTILRISEVLSLDFEMVREVDGHKVVDVATKGDKTRTVVLAPVVLRALAVQPDRAGPWFKDGYGNRASRSTVQCSLTRLGKAAGVVGNLHPHRFRTEGITRLLETQPLQDVVRTAGHASPSTTLRYDQRDQNHDQSLTLVLGSLLAAR